MLINLLLAISFTVFTLGLLVNFQKAVEFSATTVKRLSKAAHRSALLIETLLRAYSRHKQITNRQLV